MGPASYTRGSSLTFSTFSSVAGSYSISAQPFMWVPESPFPTEGTRISERFTESLGTCIGLTNSWYMFLCGVVCFCVGVCTCAYSMHMETRGPSHAHVHAAYIQHIY